MQNSITLVKRLLGYCILVFPESLLHLLHPNGLREIPVMQECHIFPRLLRVIVPSLPKEPDFFWAHILWMSNNARNAITCLDMLYLLFSTCNS